MQRTLYKYICKFETGKNPCIFANLLQNYCVVNVNFADDKRKLDCFLEKESKILKIANESEIGILKSYIKGPYAEKIISHRKTNGPYESIYDLLSVDEIKSDIVKQFCIRIVMGKTILQLLKKLSLSPYAEVPETVLALHVGPTLITWTLISKNFELIDWNYKIWDYMHYKSSYNLINSISSIVETIPLSSMYIMEDNQMTKKAQLGILQVQHQIAISLMISLSLKNGVKDPVLLKNIVSVLHPLTTARYFNMLVGNEMISSKYVIKTINENLIKVNNTNCPPINLDDEILNLYMSVKSYQQEEMNWSLLKALAFLNLVKLYYNLNENKQLGSKFKKKKD